jgi:DNA-binding transcriptional MerR regulator
MDEKEKEWTLRELAAETGVPERTIRFYISRGLVDPPLRGGRGAAYGAGHKARLEEIRKLQAKGLMLAEIAHVLTHEREKPDVFFHFVPERPIEEAAEAPDVLNEERMGRVEPSEAEVELKVGTTPAAAPAPSSALPAPEEWRAYGIADDAVVMLRAGAAPWRTRRLLSAMRQFAAMINDSNANDPKEGDDE